MKEREGGKTEANLETQRGRDLGLNEDREREEAEAEMVKSSVDMRCFEKDKA